MDTTSKKRSLKSGTPPGSLVHIGRKNSGEVKINIFDYIEDSFGEKEIEPKELLFPVFEKSVNYWINVEGVHDAKVIEKIGQIFHIHPLVMEDILNTEQRPKIENYDDYVYIVAKVLSYDETLNDISTRQESIILGENYVISFSEGETGIYDPLRERIRQGLGQIRKSGSDYLTYALLDLIVDNYFDVLEGLNDRIEFAEDELISSPAPETLRTIHQLKRQMVFLQKAIWPLREVIGALERNEISFMKEPTLLYIRDLYDHIFQIIETTETLRDIISGMLDMYLSGISNRMNEIMKVLTIISTVFIPLTFIAGLYGMNLIMPEYNWPFMYPLLWVIMLTIAFMMLAFFKKKKWW